MSFNQKALGLALAAMMVIGGMSASTASATDVFTSETEIETVTGVGTNIKLVIGSHEVNCSTAVFHGSVFNGATQAMFSAHYTGTPPPETTHTGHCWSTLSPVSVKMNDCAYVLTGQTTGGDSGFGSDATVWMTCENESEAELTFSEAGLIISIPAQTPTEGGVTYTNNDPVAGRVTVHATATGITYSCSPHFLCTLGGVPTEGNNASYTGTVVAHGENGNIEISEE